MNWTRTKATVGVGGIILLAAVGTVVKPHCFPAVNDVYIKPEFDNLKRAPAGIVTVRPTHSPHFFGKPVRNLEAKGVLLRAVGAT